MELNEKIRKYYAENQVFYNLFWMNRKNLSMHYGFWDGDTKNLHEALLNQNRVVAEKLNIRDSDMVLDAGCGVGGIGIWLAKNYGVKVIGITVSGKQVRLAKKNAINKKVGHLVNFYVKDFTSTGFPDNSFTKVFGNESICYAERKENFIKEAFRLLKPRGRLVVCDGFLNKADLDETKQKIFNDWLDGWAVPSLSTVNDFREDLRKAGFKNIEFTDKTKEVRPSSKRLYMRGILGYPIIKILNLVKVTSETQVKNVVACVKQYKIINDRIMIYGIFSVQK